MWGQCNETLKGKLRTIQNRAARIVANVKYEDADHDELLQTLEWLSVRQLIKFDLRVIMYKTLNNLFPDYYTEMVCKRSTLYIYQTRADSTNERTC